MKKEYNYFPSHSEIFDYWKTKLITKDYDVIDFVENKSVEGHVVIQDWENPNVGVVENIIKIFTRIIHIIMI